MYRAILPDGDLTCDRYEKRDQGVDLYTGDDEHLAFVPYANLIAVINDAVSQSSDRSVM